MDSENLYFNFNLINFFIISGLLQNFILAGILFFKKVDRQLANRFLAITMIIVNLHLSYLMLLDTNLDNLYPFLLWIPYSFLTAIGPLIYCYTKAMTDLDFSLAKISIKHFFPVFIELAITSLP